ncbi:MAG TPA: preprotein translocase subunit SecG [Candidatus Sulfotelmatobacter sp.]|jgi:preprotein translocase subunit SecG|nr:preprotein translocase subunit SecG [Candidatus Sulfotelmatobacter sp.]
MTVLITVLHVIVAFILIVVVLLQTGKRADLAGAFGGGGSQTAFGARGAANALSKATTYAAIIFMATSMILSLLSGSHGGGTGSVLDSVPAPAAKGAPAPAPAGQKLVVPPPPAPSTPPAQAPANPAPQGK